MSRLPLALCLALVACGRIDFDPARDASMDAPIGPTQVAEISPGGYSTCAILGNGDTYCWGLGNSGLLGDGDLGEHVSFVPKRVLVPPVIGLDTNDGGTIVWDADGIAYGWGSNVSGWLGRFLSQASPVILPIDDVVSAAHAFEGACVLRRDRSVWCAGTALTLGDGTTATRTDYAPAAISDVRTVTSGDDFFCALRMAGDVWCWGENVRGQYGDGSFDTSMVPVPGPAGPYDKIALGDQFGCGLAGGVVECWGDNEWGQLGDGQSGTMRATPAPVIGLSDAIDLAAGAHWACAVRLSGDVVCWGHNNVLAIGEPASTPMTTMPGRTIVEDAISVRSRTGVHNCALTRERVPMCWGENFDGELGRPGPVTEIPAPVEGLP